MHDLKFDRATKGISWPPSGTPRDQAGTRYVVFQAMMGMKPEFRPEALTPDLSNVLRSLLTNVNRTMALLHVLPIAFNEASRVEILARRVTSPDADDGLVDEFWMKTEENEAGHDLYHSLVQKARDKYEAIRMDTDIEMDATFSRPFATGNDEIRYVSSSGIESTLSVGMEVILHAALLGTFTAFESCATDLWIKAVDLRPKTLACNVVLLNTTASRREDKKGGADSTKSAPKQNEPGIKFSALASHDFNVSARMGQLLKDEGRANFTSLWGLKIAYYDAFRTPGDSDNRTSAPLVTFFESNYSNLKSLEAIRNLLAHRGGIVDEQFLDEVQPHSPALHALPVGEVIPADGMMVSDYLRVAINASVFLVNFVAEWLDKWKE
jgi:hypothetical protein